jgi:hypothetical protein
MYLLDLSLGSIPLKIVPLYSDTSSAVATAGTRVGSPVLEAYQEHSAIPAGSPPLCQSVDPLAAASYSGRRRRRRRSRKGPNLVSKADAGV